jgi:hypothetical protein
LFLKYSFIKKLNYQDHDAQTNALKTRKELLNAFKVLHLSLTWKNAETFLNQIKLDHP